MRAIIIASLLFVLTFNVNAAHREDWEALSDSIAAGGNPAAAEKVNAALEKISDADLEKIYGGIDLLPLTDQFKEVSMLREFASQSFPELAPLYNLPVAGNDELKGNKSKAGTQSATLPGPIGYPSTGWCPFSPNRSDADALLIAQDVTAGARVLLQAAEELWSGLSRGCDETVVILGEGGNLSLACIPADIILSIAELAVGAAETVIEHIAFCDAAVDSVEIEASFERIGHVHSDLDSHVAALATHDSAISTQLNTHDTDISTQLDQHDTDISTQVNTHDINIATLIANHHNAVTLQIATHDQEIKALLGNIQGTVDENQRLLKVSMSRQLEVMRLLITPQGRRKINTDVLSCTGDDCPTVADFQCRKGSLAWPCS